MRLSLEQLKTYLHADQFALATRMLKADVVSQLKVQGGGEILTAIVTPSNSDSYRVYIRVQLQNQNIIINSECSCSERQICQHVSAVLLKAVTPTATTSAATPPPQRRQPAHAQIPENRGSLNKQNILYILQPECHSSYTMHVNTVVARKQINGGYHNASQYAVSRTKQRNPVRFIQDNDIEILANLALLPLSDTDKSPRLLGSQCDKIIAGLLATGRCFHTDYHSPVLHLGTQRSLELQWSADIYGQQRLQWKIVPNANKLFVTPSPWYLDTINNECGPLNTLLPHSELTQLLSMPPLQHDQVTVWQKEFVQRHPGISLPMPQNFSVRESPPSKPVPRLLLTSYRPNSETGTATPNLACLSFDYAGTEFLRHEPASKFQDNELIVVKRDTDVERYALNQLLEDGFVPSKNCENPSAQDCFEYSRNVDKWAHFQLHKAPLLRRQGWCITYDDKFNYRLVNAEKWYCDAHTAADRHWFNISLGVEIEGERVDIVSALVTLIKEYPDGLPHDLERDRRPFLLNLDDGRLLPISIQRLQPMFDILLEYFHAGVIKHKQALRLNRFQISRLSELEQIRDDTQFLWMGDDDIKQLVERLRDVEGIAAVAPPAGLAANLRAYQQRGLDWLQFLREYQLAGILADDMGLGKTIQSLAHLLLEKQQGRMDKPSLVVAPTSLIFNWRQEAHKFCPELKVLTLHGPRRQRYFSEIDKYDLVLTSYPLLLRDKHELLNRPYHVLILDEAQVIKNHRSQVSRIARQFNARQRLCLTGTPMENNLGEIWTLFDFLLPGLLGDSAQFQRLYRTPIEKKANRHVAKRLARRIRPFLLRRNKEDVALELPPKSIFTQSVQLEGEQRELYESVRLIMHERIRKEIARQGIGASHIIILDALLKLRQVCCDPRLVKIDHGQNIQQSAKLELLMDMLPEMIDEGRRILLFSQFTNMLSLIEERINQADITYVKLTGQSKDRQALVQQFQQNEVPVFLISLKAGGVGLNLTAADTVIHYDPWWNPAVERQATDRAHRIGQLRPVFVYKLICEGTVEEKIQAMQQQKQALADKLYNNDTSTDPQWSEQDLERLFGPLSD